MEPEGRRARRGAPALIAWAVAFVAACGGPAPSPSGATPSPSEHVASPSPVAASSSPVSSGAAAGPIASSGSIALLGGDGTLSIVDADGRRVSLADSTDGILGFPAWSPDGSRIAVTRMRQTEDAIVVFDVEAASAGAAVEPVVILQSATIDPFYLFWTPDGEDVSYLATEAGALAMRLAPADGSAPLDGSGDGAVVRSGNPFYYDWIGRDRLLAHIGVGVDAFLGEIGLDGKPIAPALEAPGDFRSAVVSRDEASIGFVRVGDTGAGEVVIASRDGSNERAMPVFGTSAIVFAPTGSTIASIGPDSPVQAAAGFPLGPLRLIDAETGDVRTLLDGFVVGFWWSPDGKTIAALRVQPETAPTSSLVPRPSGAEAPTEVRLLFVDVATGDIRSEPAVQPGQRFISQVLAFFDQYALSHNVWAPDSSSILLPEVLPDGTTRVTVRFVDGAPPVALDGEIGFWSP